VEDDQSKRKIEGFDMSGEEPGCRQGCMSFVHYSLVSFALCLLSLIPAPPHEGGILGADFAAFIRIFVGSLAGGFAIFLVREVKKVVAFALKFQNKPAGQRSLVRRALSIAPETITCISVIAWVVVYVA
jgi:hypothetical protein